MSESIFQRPFTVHKRNVRIAILRGATICICLLSLSSVFKSQDRSTPPKPDPEKWELASTGTGDDSLTLFYFRKDSIVKLEPNIFKFWLRIYDFNMATKWKPGYNLALFQVDCKKQRMRMTSLSVYGENEKYDDKKSFDDSNAEWLDWTPDSAMEKVFSGVCKRATLT